MVSTQHSALMKGTPGPILGTEAMITVTDAVELGVRPPPRMRCSTPAVGFWLAERAELVDSVAPTR
jgi:hypothetical protein